MEREEKIGKSRRVTFAIEKRFENKLNVCVRDEGVLEKDEGKERMKGF